MYTHEHACKSMLISSIKPRYIFINDSIFCKIFLFSTLALTVPLSHVHSHICLQMQCYKISSIKPKYVFINDSLFFKIYLFSTLALSQPHTLSLMHTRLGNQCCKIILRKPRYMFMTI